MFISIWRDKCSIQKNLSIPKWPNHLTQNWGKDGRLTGQGVCTEPGWVVQLTSDSVIVMVNDIISPDLTNCDGPKRLSSLIPTSLLKQWIIYRVCHYHLLRYGDPPRSLVFCELQIPPQNLYFYGPKTQMSVICRK